MLISPLLAKLDFGDAILQVVAYDNGRAAHQVNPAHCKRVMM
jgi:hypothetical protein